MPAFQTSVSFVTVPSAPTFSGTTSWAYSTRDEVLQEQTTRVGGYTSGFGYDLAGNPTNFKGASRTFNAKNQLTGGTGLGAFVYDGNGNPTTYNGVGVTFDPSNEATQFGTMLSAGYRGDGLRAWKQGSGGAGTRTYFLYDGLTPVVELDATGAVSAVNSFGPTGLLSRSSGSSTVYYAFDERGNTAQRLDGSGNVLTSHVADAYGAVASTVSVNDPYAGFGAQHGYYTDTETNLVLCTFRYYDPALGRWLTRDPIGYEGGLNLYAYCTGNPIGLVDPLGFCGQGGNKGWRQQLDDWLNSPFNENDPSFTMRDYLLEGAYAIAINSASSGGMPPRGGGRSPRFGSGRPNMGRNSGGGAGRNAGTGGGGINGGGDAEGGDSQPKIDPFKVKFGQRKVSWNFSDGGNVGDTGHLLREGKTLRGGRTDLPPIDVIRSPGGNLVTLDNRRLLTYRTAGRDIPYNIYDLNDPNLSQEVRNKIKKHLDFPEGHESPIIQKTP
jgi:RHS repeat-associated protein